MRRPDATRATGGRSRPSTVMVLASGLLLAVMVPARAADLFVDQATGDDANDGLSWATARATVTSALESATASPEADVISVAEGVYLERMTIPADTALLGGFPTGGGTRDAAAHPTVLDGGGWTANDLSRPVVLVGDGSDGAVIDGLTIRGGTFPGVGGGVLVWNAAAIISDCTIEDNVGCEGGGVAFYYTTDRPVGRLERCLVQRNRTDFCLERPQGGGVLIRNPGTLPGGVVVSECVVRENVAWSGGAIAAAGLATIEHSVVEDGRTNALSFAGAGSVFNVAVGGSGGGVSVLSAGLVRLTNVTISAQESSLAVRCASGAAVEIASIIAWQQDGTTLSFDCPGSEANVRDSLIQGGFPGGVRILDADPLFVPGPLGDAYLSQPPVQAATSPAVDTGAVPATTAGLDTRTTSADSAPDAGVVDMGFHWRALAALTILRGTRADALAAHRTVTALPFTDDPGTLTDPALPLLFYRVAEATNEIGVQRDEAADAVRLELLGAP